MHCKFSVLNPDWIQLITGKDLVSQIIFYRQTKKAPDKIVKGSAHTADKQFPTPGSTSLH